ncbi:MAG: hypothetical protein HS122_12190 [Opitutaceae bacterium]|nr:hypothetical protein [Opitutaceae bacterium]
MSRTSRGPPNGPRCNQPGAARASGWLDGPSTGPRKLPDETTAPAWALYACLVTVGDEHGLNYYADRTSARLLSLVKSIGERAASSSMRV